MQVFIFSADWCKATPKHFYPLVSAPVMTNTFANAPVNGLVYTNLWNAQYSAVSVDPSAFLWDAITVGYGWVADAISVAGIQGQDLVAIAVARARWLQAALDTSPFYGPQFKGAFKFVERTEQATLMFLVGQAMANLMGRTVWKAPRLFHVSLFGPLLIPGYAALPNYAGADYICEASGSPAGQFSSIEAKGRQLEFDPDGDSSHRRFLELGLNQSASVGFTPDRNALALATYDAAFPGLIVGQFWDPSNKNASTIEKFISTQLKRSYFISLMKFLDAFGEPMPGAASQSNDEVTWDCQLIGFEVSMSKTRYDRIRALDTGDDGTSFADWLDEQDEEYRRSANDGAPLRFNHDGLALRRSL